MKDVIEQFIVRYQNEIDYYTQTAKICAHQLENKLESSGIKATVTFRAKRPERLADKLRKRSSEKNYHTFEDIYKDIVDLAGVRIAFYFPDDMLEIDKIIQNQFHVIKSIIFPAKGKRRNNKIFPGYKAKHYRVNLDKAKLKRNDKQYSKPLIEIQVASILMLGWAEVEHDLVYKPLSGDLSEEELAILDELNGLVLTGEIALDRLHKAFRRRIVNENKQFNTHFELASYIYQVIKNDNPRLIVENLIGNVYLLYKFIKEINFNWRDKIKKYISSVVFNQDTKPVAEQIFELILIEHPVFQNDFDKLKT